MYPKWQHYRSNVNGNDALISVDLNYIDDQKIEAIHIVQFSLPFLAEENGLPNEASFQQLVKKMLKISTLIGALEGAYHVGYWLYQGKMQVYFYATKETQVRLLDTLTHLSLQDIQVQFDPSWDIYFDFLLPTSLEVKMTATEEMLTVLRQSGEDLNQLYLVDHRFYFYEERDMHQFLNYVSDQAYHFLSLQHSAIPVPIEENEKAYLVKVEQEINLEESTIFDTVVFLEQASLDFQGRYLGWKVQDKGISTRYLN